MNEAMQAQQRLMRAIQTYQMGDLTSAENEVRVLLKESPKSEQIISVLGTILLAQKKYKEAYQQYKNALKLNPLNAEAAMGMASAEHARGDVDNAITLMNQVLMDFPNRIEAHFNLGTFYITKADMEKAEACFLRCLELEPKLFQADLNLANIYKELNQLDKVEHYLRKVIAVNPDPQLKENLKEIIALNGEKSSAEMTSETKKVPNESSGLAEEDDDVDGLLSMATAHYERNQFVEAAKYFEQVLAIDPENSIASLNLRKIKASTVPRWHFEMLADHDRNDAYQEAIERALSKQPNARVLDIGTGSGLLAMMAARAGAPEVLACEMHTEIAKVAREIVKVNGYQDQVRVLNVKSSDLRQGLDYEGKFDIVVSEILDVAGIGEGVLPSLRHAYKSILKPGAVTVPAGMTMYAQLAALPAFYKVNPVREISGFDLSPFNNFMTVDKNIPVRLENHDYRLLSEPLAFYSFDFSDIPEERDISNPHTAEVEFKIIEEGEVQAVIFWFKLHLDDQLTLSSGMDGKLKHWGQAGCFMEQEIPVAPGNTVPMTAKFGDFDIWFDPKV